MIDNSAPHRVGSERADQASTDETPAALTTDSLTAPSAPAETKGPPNVADMRRLPGPNADLWDWQLHGACRGMASSYFFHPEGERGPARARREAKAKAICLDCPVLSQCRAHALAVHEPYGIWGGLSEGERTGLLDTAPAGR